VSKHTPGPWKFGKDGAIEHNNVQIYIDGADGTLIVYGQVKDADARLIAAAPDLLESLKDMVDLVELMCPFDGPQQRKARAAIARATGEQP